MGKMSEYLSPPPQTQRRLCIVRLQIELHSCFHCIYKNDVSPCCGVAAFKSYTQGCRGYGDSRGNRHGYGYSMSMGTVMNPHVSVGILWGFLNGYEIKRKLVK